MAIGRKSTTGSGYRYVGMTYCEEPDTFFKAGFAAGDYVAFVILDSTFALISSGRHKMENSYGRLVFNFELRTRPYRF